MKRIMLALSLCIGLQLNVWSQFYIDGINLQELDIEYLSVSVYNHSLLSKHIKVFVDYGQIPTFKKQEYMGPKKRELIFHSDMGILNFFYKIGWELKETYPEDIDNGSIKFLLQRKKSNNAE